MRTRCPASLVALTVVLTGCSATGQSPPTASSSDPAATTTADTTSTATTTVTAPPTAVTLEQDCPYLDTAFVADTVGQQTPTVTTTGVPGGPPPGCTFTKPNGEPAVTVEISQAADAIGARTAAVDRVAGIGGTAVDDIADGGGIAVADQQTVLAVADGTLVVVVTVNQQSSLQAREIAQVVTGAV